MEPFAHPGPVKASPRRKKWAPLTPDLTTYLEQVRHLLQDAQAVLSFIEASTILASKPLEMTEGEEEESLTLSISQTQKLLQVSRSTVYTLLNTGVIKWSQVGKRRRILRAEIVRYLDASSQAS